MARIQKPLLGLARFLGQETQGQLTAETPGTVQPTLDIERFLSPSRDEWFAVTALAVGASQVVTVPAGKRYVLEQISVRGVTSGGPSLIYPICIKTLGGATRAVFLNPPTPYYTAPYNHTNTFELGALYDCGGIQLLANDSFGVRHVTTAIPGTFTGEVYARYREIEV